MVHTRLVAPPSEAAPEAAVDPAVEAAVELESLPPQAARAAAPATTALAFRNERREIFLMIFCLLEIIFFFFKTGRRMASIRLSNYLYYKTGRPVSEWKIQKIVCKFFRFQAKPVKSSTQSCKYFIFCTKRIVCGNFFRAISTNLAFYSSPRRAAAPSAASSTPTAPKQAAGPSAAMADDPVRNTSSNRLDAIWKADSASARW